MIIDPQVDALLLQCEAIMEREHAGQVRTMGADKGKPYTVHPRRVAARFPDDKGMQALSLLHDVLEDGKITPDALRLELGAYGGMVDRLLILSRRPGESYFDYIMRVREDAFCRRLKKADLEDNMESLEEGSMKDKYRLAHWILDHCCVLQLLT